ncbi:MAG TPA: hypothetical protein PLV32_03550, partial [Chitinophagaceae bacterium]|nr:hypothetical protein [Chitinophagaceae bacterium]
FDYDERRQWRTGLAYTMSGNGLLTSSANPSVPSTPSNGEYRYQQDHIPAGQSPGEIERQIEQEKERRRESERRIKELERQKREARRSAAVQPERMDDKDDYSSISSPSPVFSLIKSFI